MFRYFCKGTITKKFLLNILLVSIPFEGGVIMRILVLKMPKFLGNFLKRVLRMN